MVIQFVGQHQQVRHSSFRYVAVLGHLHSLERTDDANDGQQVVRRYHDPYPPINAIAESTWDLPTVVSFSKVLADGSWGKD